MLDVHTLSAEEAEAAGFDSTLRSGPMRGHTVVQITLPTGDRVVGYFIPAHHHSDDCLAHPQLCPDNEEYLDA